MNMTPEDCKTKMEQIVSELNRRFRDHYVYSYRETEDPFTFYISISHIDEAKGEASWSKTDFDVAVKENHRWIGAYGWHTMGLKDEIYIAFREEPLEGS